MTALPDTRRPERWTVQRAGNKGHYLPGWFAFSPDRMGESAWFPTQPEATRFADSRARAAQQQLDLVDGLARWGVEHRPYVPEPAKSAVEDPLEVAALYESGMGAPSIAKMLSISTGSVYRSLESQGVQRRPRNGFANARI